MSSYCGFGCWCTSVPVYCPKRVEFRETGLWWTAAIVDGVFLDCDSICVGQQARCVTAFLLLLAAEWAAYFKQIQMHIMGGNDFLSPPRVLWWAVVAVSLCNWRPVWFVCFICSIFLKAVPGWRGVESQNVLAGCRTSLNGSFNCFTVPSSFRFQDKTKGYSVPTCFLTKPCFRLPLSLQSFSFSPLLTCTFSFRLMIYLPQFTELPFIEL